MIAQALRDEINSILNDVMFTYHDKWVFINPHNVHNFELSIDDDFYKIYTSIDELMQDPIFDGKCLNEIAEQVILK